MYGADPVALDQLAAKFDGAAQSLRTCRASINHQLDASPWAGPDAEDFRGVWSGMGGRVLESTAAELERVCQQLHTQASEQRTASSPDGGVGGGVGAIGAPDRRPDLGGVLHQYQVADDRMVNWEPPWPASLLTDPVQITQTEAGYLDRLSLLKMKDFQDIRNDSFAVSKRHYPGSTVREQNDGHQDAFRHTYWTALLTQKFGPEWAGNFTAAHEGVPGNEAQREAMDLYNDGIGKRIAMDHPHADKAQLEQLVAQAVQRGDTVVIGTDGQLAWSNTVKVGDHGLPADHALGGGGHPKAADSGDAARGTGS